VIGQLGGDCVGAPALPSSETMLLGMFGSPVFAIVRLLNVVEFRPVIA
jgi:hypothetical protein